MSDPQWHITLLPTVGVYGVDQWGEHWTTFWLANGEPVRCQQCDAAIMDGWIQAKTGRRVCAKHVIARRGRPA